MTSETEAPSPGAGRILRRGEVERLRAADRLAREAEELRETARREGEALKQDLIEEARNQALRERAQAAITLIARAEIEAEARLKSLEPEIARLVSDTVLQVIGEFDRDEAVTRAAATALRRLKDHRRAQIRAAPEMAAAVRRAVAEAGPDAAQVLEVAVDERLEPGRAVLSSDKGHVEIGLAAQIEAATAPWRDGREGEA